MTLPGLTGDLLDRLLEAPVAVLFKHSTRCAFSSWAHDQVTRFAAERPDVPVAVVDVMFDRALSDAVETRLGIRHESPQALLIRNGTVAWHGSHGAVTATALHAALK